MMKYWIRDREEGNRITWTDTREEAEELIKAYEKEDKEDGTAKEIKG